MASAPPSATVSPLAQLQALLRSLPLSEAQCDKAVRCTSLTYRVLRARLMMSESASMLQPCTCMAFLGLRLVTCLITEFGNEYRIFLYRITIYSCCIAHRVYGGQKMPIATARNHLTTPTKASAASCMQETLIARCSPEDLKSLGLHVPAQPLQPRISKDMPITQRLEAVQRIISGLQVTSANAGH